MKNDNGDDRLERLFAAARKYDACDPKLQYGFETRMLTKIKEHRAASGPFFLWAWRLIPALFAMVLMLGAWIYITEHSQPIGLNSITGINNEETMLVASLTGE
ncbi:MAG TPA: hypothetical protein VMB78_09845 [Dissulfurispiraceae bacterium]|nr:hypothetical protein [Dissulfurispiraceae bacterium]